MTEHETVEKGSNVAVGILFAVILTGVLLLAVVLVTDAISSASLQLHNTTYTTVYVANETGWLNATGYTLSGASALGFVSPVALQCYNGTDGTVVDVANISISSLGVIKNVSAVAYRNINISYRYNYDTTSTNPLNTAITGIKTNTASLFSNFFALAPTIGTILAVVILLAGIVLLVMYVKRMKNTEGSSEEFAG
jgi:hypothetical protein